MQAIKTRKRQNEQTGRQKAWTAGKKVSMIKIAEIAFWGTIFWGIFRMIAHFLNLTPYGLGAYARPVLGVDGEGSWEGIVLGGLLLFVETLIAALLFSFLFRKARFRWAGILYGAVLLMIAGYFFRIANWELSTFSTEAAWFLSFGLFIGMTLTLEHSDVEW